MISKYCEWRPAAERTSFPSRVFVVDSPSTIPRSVTVAALPDSCRDVTVALPIQLNPNSDASSVRLELVVHVENGLSAADDNETVSSTETRYGSGAPPAFSLLSVRPPVEDVNLAAITWLFQVMTWPVVAPTRPCQNGWPCSAV